MAKFRRKSVVVEAISAREAIRTATLNWKRLPTWLRDAYGRGDVYFFPDYVRIKSFGKNDILAEQSDWIIYGPDGEISSRKPDTFKLPYERLGKAALKG